MPRMALKLAALVPVCALVWAGGMMYVAWQHNPQNVFHEESGLVHWGDWLLVGGLNFIVATVAAIPLWLLLCLVVALVRAVIAARR